MAQFNGPAFPGQTPAQSPPAYAPGPSVAPQFPPAGPPAAAPMYPPAAPPGVLPRPQQPAGLPPVQAAPSSRELLGGQAPPPADIGPREAVVDVRIEGNETIEAQRILSRILTRQGREFDPAILENDILKLNNTHWFVHVDPRTERTPQGVVVIIRVVEQPTLQSVKFVGNTKRSSKLAKETGLKKGDRVDPYMIEEARIKLERFYHEQGFSKATVQVWEGDKPGDRRAVFVINEGVKQKVWKVEFNGNEFVSASRLKTLVQSKPPILYLFKGEVDRAKVDDDVDRLLDYYRGFGYFSARISRELEFDDDQKWATLTFDIDEGPRYQVENVSVIGNEKYAAERLLADMKLLKGEPYDLAKATKDSSAIMDLYGSQGYAFCSAQPQLRFYDEPGRLDIVYKVEEGDRYVVGRIDVEINGDDPHTRRDVVLNRLTFRTGEVVDTRKFRDSERRLKLSGLFLVDPAKGAEPKIVFSPPSVDELDEEQYARARGQGFRGQSPDGAIARSASRDRVVNLRVSCDATGIVSAADSVDAGAHRQVAARPIYLNAPPTPRASRDFVVRGQSPTGQPAYTTSAFGAAQQPTVGQLPMGRTDPYASYQVNPSHPAPSPNAFGAASAPPPASRAAWSANAQAPAAQPQYAQQASSDAGARPMVPVGPRPHAQSAPVSNSRPSGVVAPVQYTAPAASAPAEYGPPFYGAAPGGSPAGQSAPPRPIFAAPNTPNGPYVQDPALGPTLDNLGAPQFGGDGGFNNPDELFPQEDPLRELPIQVQADETQTGRFMLGVGVNSNAGLVGSIVLDEQNFDIWRFPRSWDDVRKGVAWRGRGQQFRVEAAPGTEFQRYLISFREPYLLNTPVSLGLSGSYFDRRYRDWDEGRLGGRVSLGYQFLFDPNLSIVGSLRMENVNISNPSVPTPPSLLAVLGNNGFYSGRVELIHDTRDSAFLPTQGHRVALAFEQAFGDFSYPRAEVEASQHFLVHERPDGSGRHTLSLTNLTGFSGTDTPIFENYFAGGYNTLRGFRFRGASPSEFDVYIGGRFQFINSVEYMFPITADDMLRAVVFCDFGTVEQDIAINGDQFRVSPGAGLRVTIPALGPAPIALDLAFPVARAPNDDIQNFSFFVGFTR